MGSKQIEEITQVTFPSISILRWTIPRLYLTSPRYPTSQTGSLHQLLHRAIGPQKSTIRQPRPDENTYFDHFSSLQSCLSNLQDRSIDRGPLKGTVNLDNLSPISLSNIQYPPRVLQILLVHRAIRFPPLLPPLPHLPHLSPLPPFLFP